MVQCQWPLTSHIYIVRDNLLNCDTFFVLHIYIDLSPEEDIFTIFDLLPSVVKCLHYISMFSFLPRELNITRVNISQNYFSFSLFIYFIFIHLLYAVKTISFDTNILSKLIFINDRLWDYACFFMHSTFFT